MTIAFKAAVHDPKIASFRYRVETPVAALRARGHDVELFAPERADTYRMVVFSKSYRPAEQELARAVKARGGQVALDLCDNHFYNPEDLPRYRQARKDLIAMAGLADRVIVSTPALGRVVRAEAALASDPMVVGDYAERIALPPRPTGDGPRLLWFGMHGSPNAPSGMTDLLKIAPHMRRAAARAPFELLVASNNQDKFEQLAADLGVPARYVAWTHEEFPRLLAAADAVLIPLSDNPFVACKTHNRITAALWPGVPVVADAIESYREFAPFAWLDDWEVGLRSVLEDQPGARRRASGARALIDRHWSIEALTPRWEAALGLPPVVPAKPAPAAASRPEPADTPATTRANLYQGALDAPEPDRVTGWARIVAKPTAPVTVTLETGGKTVARAIADQPRADLAAVGFRHSQCGFVLAVPLAWRDGAPRTFTVVADGWRAIETLTTRFPKIAPAPKPEAPDPAPVAPAPTRRDAPSVKQPPRTEPTASRAAPSVPPPTVRPTPSPTSSAAPNAGACADIRLQTLLADELEALDEAVDVVRRIAARIVLAAASGGLSGEGAETRRLADGAIRPNGGAVHGPSGPG